MKEKIKQLKLDQEYLLEDLIFKSQGESFHCSVLLSPAEIILKVNGDCHEDRKIILEDEVPELYVEGFSYKIFLYNLRIRKWKMTSLDFEKKVNFTECRYSAEYALLSPSTFLEAVEPLSISYQSQYIEKWIDRTNFQDEIYHKRTSSEQLTNTNFIQESTSDISFRISFDVESSASFKSFTFITRPKISLDFHTKVDALKVFRIQEEFLSLMSLFMGEEIEIEQTLLSVKNSSVPLNLYYPTQKMREGYKTKTILYPLSQDLFTNYGLPKLPLEVFSTFFSLSNSSKEKFIKYTRYKRLKDNENKYLGFFRLLESLCFVKKEYINPEKLNEYLEEIESEMLERFSPKKNVKSFLKRLPRLNESKYNTEACLNNFLSSLPEHFINSHIFGKQDLEKMCKLRNDITHANDYFIDPHLLNEYVYYIEMLLILKLFSSLGVELKNIIKLIPRMTGYLLISRKVENHSD